MGREEILDRYRHLSAIRMRHQTEAVSRLSRSTILEQAKHLGLVYEDTLVADSEEEITLIWDLAIYTAKPGRSRAIDRYAKDKTFSDPDDANMLEAMRRARFSLWRVERLHEVFGVVVTDAVRGGETWLVDENLTDYAEPGMGFAMRLFRAEEFSMTCGVVVPVDTDLVEDALINQEAWLGRTALVKLPDDPRFASAIYRAAISSGVLDDVTFEEPATALARTDS